MMIALNDTICAVSSPAGVGGIALIRLSGKEALSIALPFFKNRKQKQVLENPQPHQVYFSYFIDRGEQIDEVMVTYFQNPRTYTGEDLVEISCHGSFYIQKRILEALVIGGARIAEAGEFTLRAFMNGKMDLLQAEAVADLIHSHSKASNTLALDQLRGGFSGKIKDLRRRIVDFSALIELELDFSEEDVEFADRGSLYALLDEMEAEINILLESFALGNSIKQGVPVAIIGKPNVGKSTLLNALLSEERAIVSEIPGTTRDTIEDVMNIEGTTFRFIDTAGIRHSEDTIEIYGIERTFKAIEKASVLLYLVDISQTSIEEVEDVLKEIGEKTNLSSKKVILIANKTDLLSKTPPHFEKWSDYESIFISAKRNENIQLITKALLDTIKTNLPDTTLIGNIRHYEALQRTLLAVEAIKIGLDQKLPGDLIAIDIKQALHYLGEITGEITSDEILSNIFGRFCIGK